jgi:hypothetical protein
MLRVRQVVQLRKGETFLFEWTGEGQRYAFTINSPNVQCPIEKRDLTAPIIRYFRPPGTC